MNDLKLYREIPICCVKFTPNYKWKRAVKAKSVRDPQENVSFSVAIISPDNENITQMGRMPELWPTVQKSYNRRWLCQSTLINKCENHTYTQKYTSPNAKIYIKNRVKSMIIFIFLFKSTSPYSRCFLQPVISVFHANYIRCQHRWIIIFAYERCKV